jgi:hypothetical protein
LKLLGFAAQHFLFPSLAERLLLILIGSQLLLAPGKFSELLERLIDFLGTAIGG